MSGGPRDTMPPDEPATNPGIETPIPTGQAANSVRAGFVDLLAAVARLEAVCVAVGRALDAGGR